jgi:hypothetical protein
MIEFSISSNEQEQTTTVLHKDDTTIRWDGQRTWLGCCIEYELVFLLTAAPIPTSDPTLIPNMISFMR